MIKEILKACLTQDISDIHIVPNNYINIRIDGTLKKVENFGILTAEHTKLISEEILDQNELKILEEKLETDFSISVGDNIRFRINVYNTIEGLAIAMRKISNNVMKIDDLIIADVLKKLSKLHQGLILVTGETGSGKSTTLSAFVNYINDNYSKHIITIEDPVEFIYKSNKSLINQREVGSSTHSFSNALRGALREDPDVILVGEMRDLETIRLAITAAETGHLVLGTLHTNSAAKTVDRVVDVFPEEEKDTIRSVFASSISAVISQTLLKKADSGRVAVFEVLLANNAVRNLIRENKIPQIPSIIQMSKQVGMMTKEDSVKYLLDKKVISEQVAADFLSSINPIKNNNSDNI